MFKLKDKPDMAARLHASLVKLATDPRTGKADAMKVIQYLAGVMVETYMVFDKPDEAMQSSLTRLTYMLNSPPVDGALAPDILPPPHIIDRETEIGRQAARDLFEDWMECAFEFHELLLVVVHNTLISWEQNGQMRGETLRLLVECVMHAMAFEISAQELCDIVIDKKVAQENWSLMDCIAALSATAGHKLALSISAEYCQVFKGRDLPENLDCVVHVMTQEAVRLGVPAGSDWRMGLAANDVPASAPYELIRGVEDYCDLFFDQIYLHSLYEQAVACAKAAGRMLAVAAGGEVPELEPVIAKPLAMAAITETYKSICQQQNIASY